MLAGDTRLGRASLWVSILGLVLPVTFFFVANTFFKTGGYAAIGFFLYAGALAIVMELIAVGCGIAAWRTTSGRIGSWIALALFALGLVIMMWFIVGLSRGRIS